MDRHQSWEISSRLFCSVKSHDQITATWSMNDGAVRFDDIMDEFKEKFDGSSQWPINDWTSFLAKGWGPKKGFQYRLNHNSSKHFLYFRAIQGHSGGNLVDPELQDNLLLPEDFTEYIYLIGEKSETHSIIRGWVDPRRKKSQQGLGIFVFHCSEHDGRRSKYRRNSMRLGQAKDRSIQKYLETSSKHSVLVQFKTRSEERIAILSNTITRNRSLHHTACDLHRESGVLQDEGGIIPQVFPTSFSNLQRCHVLYWKRLRKADNKINKNKTQEHLVTTQAHRRVLGKLGATTLTSELLAFPILQSKKQDTNRRDTVKKSIQQFESHPNKESFLQDLHETEEINELSEQSQKLIAVMTNTEIFDLCETSPK